MNELQVLLAKLDKLTFTGIDKDNREVLTTSEGFRINYSTRLHNSKYGGYVGVSVQFLLSVVYGDRQVAFWGCSTAEDTKEVVDWFLTKKSACRGHEEREQERVEKEGMKLFSEL